MRKTAHDLGEYFASAEHLAGFKAMAIAGPTPAAGASSSQEPPTDRRFDTDGAMVRRLDRSGPTLRRHARIRHALARLGKQDNDILWLAFGPELWPVQISKAFGKYTGVCLITQSALSACPENPGLWLRTIVARNDRDEIRATQSEANRMVQFALWAFEAELKRQI